MREKVCVPRMDVFGAVQGIVDSVLALLHGLLRWVLGVLSRSKA